MIGMSPRKWLRRALWLGGWLMLCGTTALRAQPSPISVTVADQIVEFETQATFEAVVHRDDGGLLPRYQWYKRNIATGVDTDVPGATNASLVLPKVGVDDARFSYFVHVEVDLVDGGMQEATSARAMLYCGYGLTGKYYDNNDFTAFKLRRVDRTLDFDWGVTSPDSRVGSDHFSVRWTGKIQALFSGLHEFKVVADDDARVWIDGDLVVDDWTGAYEPAGATGSRTLQAGRLYDIKIEFREFQGEGKFSLRWRLPVAAPGSPHSEIESYLLYPTPSMPPQGAFDEISVAGGSPSQTLIYAFRGETISMRGWAGDSDDEAPVDKVSLRLDGAWISDATLNGERQDVVGEHPEREWRFSGWTLNDWPVASSLAAGPHTISAEARDLPTILPARGGQDQGIITQLGSKTLQVMVPPAFSTLPSNQSILLGGNVTFSALATGSPAPTYAWRKGSPSGTVISNAASYTLNNVEIADEGTYYVTATVTSSTNASSARSVTASATLTVQVPPGIISQPSHQTVLEGTPATFTVAGSGRPAPVYRWHRRLPGGSFSPLEDLAGWGGTGAATATLVVTNTMGMNGVQFQCYVSNDVSPAVWSNVATLTVTVPVAPQITSSPSATFTVGQFRSFPVTATGNPSPVVTAANLPSWATFSGGTLSGTAPDQSGSPFSITFTATNGVNPAATQNFELTVVPAPASPTISNPGDQAKAAGEAAVFSITAGGYPLPTLQWQRALAASPNSWSPYGAAQSGNSSSLTVPSVTAGMSGDRFRCVATNASGSATSGVAVLTVATGPTISGPADVTARLGQAAVFTVTTSASPPFAWYQNSVLQGGTGASLTTAPVRLADHNTFFWVTVGSGSNAATSRHAKLTVVTGDMVNGVFRITGITYGAEPITESHSVRIQAGAFHSEEPVGGPVVAAANSQVEYVSTTSVVLSPGFRAVAGSRFTARVTGTPYVEPPPPPPVVPPIDSPDAPPSTNRAPTIAWAQSHTSAVVGTTFSIQVGATDADGNLQEVLLWRDGVLSDPPLVVSNPASFTSSAISFTPTMPGNLRYTAQAIDARGARSAMIEMVVAVDWSSTRTPLTPLGGTLSPTPLPLGENEQRVVATLPGAFSVDNKGSANYSIPLSLPPGRSGLQPSLSINYSSSGGNGPLGVGASLSTGFPQAISRGRTILARDGQVRGVTFTSQDKLYLDGKRLLCISGTEGAPDSVYRTEVDSFVTITACGAPGGAIEGFRMMTKEGLMLCFGQNVPESNGASGVVYAATDGYHLPAGEATQAAAWALKWVEDTLGNYIEFTYNKRDMLATAPAVDFTPGPGEHVLTSIRYTGNRRLEIGPRNTVWLRHNNPSNRSGLAANAGRPDAATHWQAGRSTALSVRLDDIVVATTPATVASAQRSWRLRYDAGSGNSTLLRLVEVSQRDVQGGNIRVVPETKLEWPLGAVSGYHLTAPSASTTLAGSNLEGSPSWQGDFNGDGRSEILYRRGGALIMMCRTPGGAWSEVSATMPSGTALVPGDLPLLKLATTGDFNGDGRTDLIWVLNSYRNPRNGWYVSLARPATSDSPFLFDAPRPINPAFPVSLDQLLNAPDSALAADLDGDGCDEFLFQSKPFNVNLNPVDGLPGEFADDAVDPENNEDYIDTFLNWLSGNEAGKCSVMPHGRLFALRFNRSDASWSFNEISLAPFLEPAGPDYTDPMSFRKIDLDGDGRADFVVTYSSITSANAAGLSASAEWVVRPFLNSSGGTGYSFVRKSDLARHGGVVRTGSVLSAAHLTLTGDINGDGLDDILLFSDQAGTDATPGWRVAISKGDGTFDRDSYQGLNLTEKIRPTDAVGVRTYFQQAGAAETSVYSPPPDAPEPHDVYYISSFTGFAISGVSLLDLNGDGRKDFVWYAGETEGWRCFLAGRDGFAKTNALPLFGANNTLPLVIEGNWNGLGNTLLCEAMPVDLTAEGREGLLLMFRSGVRDTDWNAVALAPNDAPARYRVLGATDGFGTRLRVDYQPISNDAVYTQGAPVTYPIRESRHKQVVSDVWKDAGGDQTAGAWSHFSYQYSGNRVDLSGRGSLGFHSFVTLDHQTGLFKYQFVVQSFPMTGLTHRDETYRWWTEGGRHFFRFLSSHDNTVVFDRVVGGNGSLWPFISRAVESRWEDGQIPHFNFPEASSIAQPEALFPSAKPGGAHITISAESRFDDQTAVQITLPPGLTGFNPSDISSVTRANTVAGTLAATTLFNALPAQITHGNLKHLATAYGDGFSETVATTFKPVTDGLAGLVDTVTTTTESPVGGTETAPIKAFTYWSMNGRTTPLVETETINAGASEVTNGDAKLTLRTSYARDARGRVTSTTIAGHPDETLPITDPRFVGSYVVSSVAATDGWDDNFDLPKRVRNAAPYAHETLTTFHSFFGLPESITDVNGAETRTTYDVLGRVATVTDVLKGLTTTSSYRFNSPTDAAGDAVVTVTPPEGTGGIPLSSAYTLTVTADAQPTVKTYFDRLARPLRVMKDGFGSQIIATDTAYNVLGQAVATSLPYPSGPNITPGHWTRTFYDRLGRVAVASAPNGTITTSSFRGRVTQVEVDARFAVGGNGGAPLRQTNTTLVDAKGRTVKVWNADNVPDLERLTADDDGAATTSTPPSLAFDFDGFGRMRTTHLRGQSQIITAEYDAQGRQTALNDPDKGAWTYLNNALGQIVRQQDARGSVTISSFDRLGRPLVRTTAEPSIGPVETAKCFYYDAPATANNSANAALQLVPAGDGAQGWIGALQRQEASTSGAPGYAGANSDSSTTNYYDNKGRPSIALTTVDGKWFYTLTDYDSYSRVQQVRYHWRPAGIENPTVSPYAWQEFGYTYAYDAKSHVLSLTDLTGRSWWDNPVYDHVGRVTQVRKGSGPYTTRTYRSEDGVLTSIRTGPTAGSSSLQNLTFGFDGLGNLTFRTGAGGTERLSYDVLNRLTYSSKQGTTAYVDDGHNNGNIRRKPDVNGVQPEADFVYGDAARPHAVTQAWGYTMTYDANGNVDSRSRTVAGQTESWIFRYAGFDKPRWMARTVTQGGTATTVGSEFIYDPNRSRSVHLEFDQVSGGAPGHYARKRVYGFGGALEINYNNTATSGAPTWAMNKVRIYISGPDGTVGVREFDNPTATSGTEKALVYHHDHLGSIDVVTHLGSTVVPANDGAGKPGRFSEDAWGQRRNPDTWLGTPTTTDDGGADSLSPRGFTGHEMLDELGFIHMNGRIYDPLSGRMLSADTLVQYPVVAQSYNRYSYVGNRPLSYTDPTGFFDVGSLITEPVHERIALDAFAMYLGPGGIDWKNNMHRDFAFGLMAGVPWPDMPEGLPRLVQLFASKSLAEAPGIIFPPAFSDGPATARLLSSSPRLNQESAIADWAMKNEGSLTYESHFGKNQFWHAMSFEGARDAKDVQEAMVGRVTELVVQARADLVAGRTMEAGENMGKALHTVADSWPQGHTVREADRTISMFQDYRKQNGHEHKKFDGAKNSAEILGATLDSKKVLEHGLAGDFDPDEFREFLRKEIFPINEKTKIGESRPEIKKPPEVKKR